MELVKQTIRKTKEVNREFSQISLDDDYIVKDNKPDVIKIIHAKGNIIIDETKVSNQAVWLNGRLEFRILYRSDDEFHKLDVVTGVIPFQEKVMVDDIDDLSRISVHAQLEDLNASIINSRKVAIRAVLGLYVAVTENGEEEIAGSLLEGGGYEQKAEEQELLKLVTSQKDVLRISNEVKLPNAKPNIRSLLWQNVDVRNMESSILAEKLHIQGEAYIGILYQSDEDDQVQWYETMVPVAGDVAIEGEQGDIFWVKVQPDSPEVEARNDYDGENRILGVDISLCLEYKLWKEENTQILKDVYSTTRKVDLERTNSVLPRFLMKNIAKTRISEQFKIEANQEKILQICAYDGTINVDRVTTEPNGILFEGVLKVHILYFTSDDNLPIEHIEAILPFEQLVEVNQMTENTWCDYQAAVDVLQVNLLDNSEYEIKAAIRIAVLAFEEDNMEHIVEVREGEPLVEELRNQPGMIGYIVQEKEQLWDIAKENHTTIRQIMEENGLKSDKVAAGMKLIIVKNMTSC